jgi:hypothetical protein
VDNLFSKLVEARILESSSRDSGEPDRLFSVNAVRKTTLCKELVDKFHLDFLKEEAAKAAKALQGAAEEGYDLDPPLERWAQLAEEVREDAGTARLLKEVEAGLKEAREHLRPAAPRAARWVETAGLLADVFGGPLQIAVIQAKRRIELYHRRAYDARYLENYFRRDTAEKAFRELITAENYWALHYVGLGGTGKTMLMRWFSQLEYDLNLATTRVDFDNLNPVYPSREPGLLLQTFAEEFRFQGEVEAEESFKTFDYEVKRVHDEIEAASRSGIPAEVSVRSQKFRPVVESFVWALQEAAGERTPVLIVDTCEELAKVRSDRAPAENVKATFELIELIHDLNPRVRVVFSGRRPLGSAGFKWQCRTSSLPPRNYLALFEVRGFTDEEAIGFLQRYERRKDGRRVNLGLTPVILELSGYSDESDKRFQWDDGRQYDTVRRHSPFDLDIFANWSCDNPDLDEGALRESGRHHYVQERIVGRLEGPMKLLLPVLALLGRFSRDLMYELAREYDPLQSNRLLEEMKAQEWVDLDRGGGPMDWMLDNAMRSRLLLYYREREPRALSVALGQLGQLLGRFTLDREWHDLKAEYFDLVLSALKAEPVAAAWWWRAVELKIVSTRAWNWAYHMLELLLGDGGAAEEVDSALGLDPADENPLRAAVLATYAAVLTHFDAGNPREAWEEALAKVNRHPLNATALRWRAEAGVFASSLRTPDVPLSEKTLAACQNFLSSDLPNNDEQTLASILAVLESLTEALERSELEPVGFSANVPEIAELESKPLSLSVFYHSLRGRLYMRVGNVEQSIKEFNTSLNDTASVQGLQGWLDWEPPLNLTARIKLELVRAFYPAEKSAGDLLARLGEAPKTFSNLDEERLASIILLFRSAIGLPSQMDYRPGIEQSFKLAKVRPVSNAHREIPPYFVAALEALTALGALDQASRLAIDFITSAEAELTAKRQAHRTLMYITLRMRLRDEGITWSSGIERLDSEADFERWFLGPSTLPALATAPFAKNLADQLPGATVRRTSDAIADRVGYRFAAEILLKEAYVQVTKSSGGLLFAKCCEWFEVTDDSQGALLGHISLAMLHARRGERKEFDAELGKSWTYYERLEYLPERKEIDLGAEPPPPIRNAVNAITRAERDRFWRPWLLRILACMVRSREFDEPGPRTSEFRTYLGSYGDKTKDMEGVLSVKRSLLTRVSQNAPDLLTGALGLGIFGLMIWGVWKLGEYSVAPERVAIFLPILTVALLLPVLLRWLLERSELIVHVEPLGKLEDRNHPLLLPSRVTFGTYLPSFSTPIYSVLRWAMDRLAKSLPPKTLEETRVEAYAELAKTFPRGSPGFKILKTLSLGLGNMPFPVRLELDRSDCSAPWEVIFSLAAPDVKLIRDTRFRFRRTVPRAREVTLAPLKSPAMVLSVATGLRDADVARRAWSVLENRPGFSVTSLTAPQFLTQSQVPAILHMTATPVETASGLVLEVKAMGEAEASIAKVRQQVRSESWEGGTRYLLSTENLIGFSSPPRLCVIQLPPGLSTRRTPADRRNAALLRRFGSELYYNGVAAVVLLPKLTEDFMIFAIGQLAKVIAERPRNATRRLAKAIHRMQERLEAEQNDQISSTELPFDICFYSVGDLNFEIQSASQST